MKKVKGLMLILVCGMCLVGCKNVKIADSKLGNEEIVGDVAKEEAKMETISLKVYDAVLDEVVLKSVEVSEVTANDIIDAYINEFCVVSGCTKEIVPNIESVVTSEENEVYIDFDSIVNNMGSYGEALYIENMHEAIFDNMPKVNKVYVTVKGGRYESGHLMWEANEAFIRPETKNIED